MKKVLCLILVLLSASSLWGEWNELEIKSGDSLWASSVLTETIKGKTVDYPPENLFDSDPSTAWVEGVKGYGKGENLLILTNKIISGFSMVNGFAKSEQLFSRNSRVRELSVSFVCGLNAPGLVTENDYYLYFAKETALKESVAVKDTMEKQIFPLYDTEEYQDGLISEMLNSFAEDYPDFFKMILNELGIEESDYSALPNMLLIMEMYGFIGLKLTVTDIYPGSRYDDTCISEIGVDF